MAKECNYKDCTYPVFSGGYCKFHQHVRIDNKRPRIKKRKAIRVSNKPTGELSMFLEIYEENKDKWVSRLSGIPLAHRNGFMFINQFAHLLAKGRFPHYRLNKENIWCITAFEHSLLDQGTSEQREAYAKKMNFEWEPIYSNIADLKKQYYAEFGR